MNPGTQDTYCYKLKDGDNIVYIGITNDLYRRKKEHIDEGKIFSEIVQIGSAVNRSTAEKWEEIELEQYRKKHNGDNPKYNKTDQ